MTISLLAKRESLLHVFYMFLSIPYNYCKADRFEIILFRRDLFSLDLNRIVPLIRV